MSPNSFSSRRKRGRVAAYREAVLRAVFLEAVFGDLRPVL